MHPSPSPALPSHLPSVAGVVKGCPTEVVNGIQVSSTDTRTHTHTHTKGQECKTIINKADTHRQSVSAKCVKSTLYTVYHILLSLIHSIPFPEGLTMHTQSQNYVCICSPKPQRGRNWDVLCFEVTTESAWLPLSGRLPSAALCTFRHAGMEPHSTTKERASCGRTYIRAFLAHLCDHQAGGGCDVGRYIER